MSSITLRLYIAMICTTLLGALSPAIAQAQSPNDILVLLISFWPLPLHMTNFGE